MDGYLLGLSHYQDDVPLSLHETLDEACAAARLASWDVPSENAWHEHAGDASTPICMWITRFAYGIPVERTVVRNYEEEAAEEEATQ